MRWQNDPQMNAEQLRRLVKDAEREAREAAATEGYFSAQRRDAHRRNRRPMEGDA